MTDSIQEKCPPGGPAATNASGGDCAPAVRLPEGPRPLTAAELRAHPPEFTTDFDTYAAHAGLTPGDAERLRASLAKRARKGAASQRKPEAEVFGLIVAGKHRELWLAEMDRLDRAEAYRQHMQDRQHAPPRISPFVQWLVATAAMSGIHAPTRRGRLF